MNMNSEIIKQEWVDIYAPKVLNDYVLDPEIKQYFWNMINSRSVTSMSFSGIAGSGKTTLCKILCNELNADVLFIKCATEGVIDTLRTKVEPFCNAMSMEGKLKIVILDEIDSASQTGSNNFQMALRTLIEASQSDTRFFLTCNFPDKVIPAILSRCPVVPLSFSKKDLLLHVKKILDTEVISYNKESLKDFIEESFKYYPDVRRIIKYLQMCCNDKVLKIKKNVVINNAQDDFMKELVYKTISEKNLLNVRQFYVKAKDKICDYIDTSTKLFNYVVDNDIITDADGILVLSDFMYKMNIVVDKESMFFGMLTAVNKYSKGLH